MTARSASVVVATAAVAVRDWVWSDLVRDRLIALVRPGNVASDAP